MFSRVADRSRPHFFVFDSMPYQHVHHGQRRGLHDVPGWHEHQLAHRVVWLQQYVPCYAQPRSNCFDTESGL